MGPISVELLERKIRQALEGDCQARIELEMVARLLRCMEVDMQLELMRLREICVAVEMLSPEMLRHYCRKEPDRCA